MQNAAIRKTMSAALILLASLLSSANAAFAEETQPSGVWSSHVKGIGGVFVKFDDPQRANDWYQSNFGMDVKEFGYTFYLWRDYADSSTIHRTVWSAFPKSSEHFGKADQQVMINYIVDDLDSFLVELKEKGVVQVGGLEEYDHGRFAWVIDVEGNKVELWEPPAVSVEE